MNNGWIKLYRSILDWEWYDDMNTRMLFIHCLLKANCRDTKYHGEVIKRGTFLTSVEILSLETGLTKSQIRTSLNKLKMTNDIANDSSGKGSIISITNYDEYQSNDKPNDNEIASGVTNQSQTDDKPIATNKNNKNEKKLLKEAEKPDGVSDETWHSWVQLRKSKKWSVSKIAVDSFLKDCQENNADVESVLKFWIAYKSGWQGFRFEWLKPEDFDKIKIANKTEEYWDDATGKIKQRAVV